MDKAGLVAPVIAARGWRQGPPWEAVALVLLAFGVLAVVAGFDAAFYAEFGGREGPERAIHCTPQEGGGCVSPTLIQQQAARESKLMSKLNSVGNVLAFAGLVLFVAGFISIGAAVAARRRRRGGTIAPPTRGP